jgi:hypothetical protein
MTNPARADLDPGLQKPYELHVVLHIAEHRFLTSIFQDQVERQLRDHLQLTFGKLANVKILRTHPLLGEVRTRGLQQALDGWDDLSGVQTHFVLIDFVNGRYEIQARQHDGTTGLSSPVVRRDATSDRRLVARRAALLIDQDFGLVGTVIPGEDDKVRVALQGGTLGVPLKRWIKSGDVFAVARITQEGDRQRATRLDWAVLQVIDESVDGVCHGRFFTRYVQNKLVQEPSILGYRCLKLTTTRAPLRLRLLEGDNKIAVPLLFGVQVHVSPSGFDAPDAIKVAPDPDGSVKTQQPFAGIAFVQVLSGREERARFPVEIVDDRTVVCQVRANPEADAQGQLELRKDRWVRRIYDLLLADVSRVQFLNEQLRSSREDALATARSGLVGLKEDMASLKLERAELRKAANKARLDLNEGDQRLEQLEKHRAKLADFVGNLDRVLQEESSEQTKALRTLLERAGLLERQAEFDEAIKLYHRILAEKPDQPKVRAHLENLERDWKIVSDSPHQKARSFIYNTWAMKMDTASLKAELPKARDALAVCRKYGDRLTPQKFLQATLAHGGALMKRLAVLGQRESEDNRNETRAIRQLAEELDRLHHEAAAFVHQKSGSGP